MDKFRHKLPKDVLKKHAKDVNKSLVASDYKHNRVDDPTCISEKTEKKVKKYVKDFLDKAVIKHREHEKHKAEREAQPGVSAKAETSGAPRAIASVETPGPLAGDDDVVMSDVEDIPTSSPVKRKREEDVDMMEVSLTPEEMPLTKRLKEESPEEPSPPPPPPPPPDAAMVDDLDMTPSRAEAFSHEQEEANRLADEAEQDRVRQEEALQRENEEAMRDFELEQSNQQGSACSANAGANKKHENEQHNKQMILGQ